MARTMHDYAGMHTLPLRILLLAGSTSLTDGAQLGVEEAARTAAMFSLPAPQLVVLDAARLPTPLSGGTVLITSQAAACDRLVALAREARALTIGVSCAARAAAERPVVDDGASNVFRIAAAEAGTVLWDASLEAFGAAQLNQRFRQRFGLPMDADAWAGWMAVKAVTEASLRTRSTAPDSLRRYLERPESRFDGHKGAPLSFGPSHVLTSPAYQRDTTSALAFVSNEGSHTISVIDLASRRVVGTIAVDGRPRGIRVSPDGRRLFVALSDDQPTTQGSRDAVVAIDIATRRVVQRFAVGTDPEQFIITPDGSTLVASNEDAGSASVVDLRSGGTKATLLVGIEPEGVAVSRDGRWVYVTAETSSTVSMIDTRTNKVVANLLVDVRPRAATFSPDGTRAWVTAEIGGTLTAIDTRTHAITGTVSLQGGTGKPVGVVTSPDGAHVYVANGAAHCVSVVDARTLRETASIPVGRRPWGIALSSDGRTAYTANGLSNDISVIDVASRRTVATITVGTRPWGIAITR